MAEKDSSGYYIRGEDGKAFGPVELATLVEWAGDSRVGPTSSVSRDQTNWIAAPLVPELGMTWLVEAEQGVFYGPFNRRVVDGLLESGAVARDTRLYELSGGGSAAEQAKLKAELDAKTASLADLEARVAAQAETTRNTIAFMESKIAELTGAQASAEKAAAAGREAMKAEVFRTRERAEAAEERAAKAEAERDAAFKKAGVLETELADLRSQLEAVTRFSALAKSGGQEVVQPEVVVSDAPPPKTEPRFAGASGAAGLAALEAAARRELASAKKQGISLGGIFGGKK